ncbi:MAG: hypothetical protein ACRDKG_01510, partial [Actinomycetota bacterium]
MSGTVGSSRRRGRVLLAMIVLICAIAAVVPARTAVPTLDGDPVDFVDPMIGTLGSGFVFPGPAAPYGMVQL